MAKSTKAAKEFRVNTVYKLLTDGKCKPSDKSCSSAADEWNISNSAGLIKYIADARLKSLKQDCTISRQEFLAEAIVGLRSIRQQAERRGQYQVAVNTVRLMTELVGLDK